MPGVTVVQVTSLESQRWCPLAKQEELQCPTRFRTPKLHYGIPKHCQPDNVPPPPPFLRLPLELRQHIIRLALPQLSDTLQIYTDVDPAIVGNALWRHPTHPHYREHRQPPQFSSPPARYYRCPHAKSYHAYRASVSRDALAVLRLNHQIYHEALPLLYSTHLFHFVGYSYLPVLHFVRGLGPEARSLVHRVRLSMLGWVDGDSATEVGVGFGGGGECKVVSKNQRIAEVLCTVLHEYLPGLMVLRADPWVWT